MQRKSLLKEYWWLVAGFALIGILLYIAFVIF